MGRRASKQKQSRKRRQKAETPNGKGATAKDWEWRGAGVDGWGRKGPPLHAKHAERRMELSEQVARYREGLARAQERRKSAECIGAVAFPHSTRARCGQATKATIQGRVIASLEGARRRLETKFGGRSTSKARINRPLDAQRAANVLLAMTIAAFLFSVGKATHFIDERHALRGLASVHTAALEHWQAWVPPWAVAEHERQLRAAARLKAVKAAEAAIIDRLPPIAFPESAPQKLIDLASDHALIASLPPLAMATESPDLLAHGPHTVLAGAAQPETSPARALPAPKANDPIAMVELAPSHTLEESANQRVDQTAVVAGPLSAEAVAARQPPPAIASLEIDLLALAEKPDVAAPELSASVHGEPAVAGLEEAPSEPLSSGTKEQASETARDAVAELAVPAALQCTADDFPATPVRAKLAAEAILASAAPDDETAFGRALAAAAMTQIDDLVIYSARYVRIAYPGGDTSPLFGVCTDVLIRAYRALGIDLQELVHLSRPGQTDRNIDHRRTEVLRGFFARHGKSLPLSGSVDDFLPGDIVTYYRPQNKTSTAHIGLVSNVMAPSGRPMIIHNRGWGVQLEDALFVDQMTGHYRFEGLSAEAVAALPRAAAQAKAGSARTAVVRIVARSGSAASDAAAATRGVTTVPVAGVRKSSPPAAVRQASSSRTAIMNLGMKGAGPSPARGMRRDR